MLTAADLNCLMRPGMVGVMLTAAYWYGLVLPDIVWCNAHRCLLVRSGAARYGVE